MNALKTLDAILHKQSGIEFEDSETIDFDLTEEGNTRTVTADVKIADDSDIIIKDNNGIYHKVNLKEENGEITLYVNGEVRDQFNIGISPLLEDGYYDEHTEKLILIFKLHNSQVQRVEIPVDKLIAEWETGNTLSITLNKSRVIDGPDVLTAELNVSKDTDNGISVKNDGVFASKNAKDLVYKQKSVEAAIDDLEEDYEELELRVQDLESSVDDIENDILEIQDDIEEIQQNQAEDLAKITELQGKLNGIESVQDELDKKADIEDVPTLQQGVKGTEKNYIYSDPAVQGKGAIAAARYRAKSNGKLAAQYKYWGDTDFNYDTEFPTATETTDGVMSAADKIKLRELEEKKANIDETTVIKDPDGEVITEMEVTDELEMNEVLYTRQQVDAKFAQKAEIVDMATQTWVKDQHYISEHQSLEGLATKAEVNESLNTISAALGSKADKVQTQQKLEELDRAIREINVDDDIQKAIDALKLPDTYETIENVKKLIAQAKSEIIGGADQDYDTLKEIETWITTHQDVYQALVSTVAQKATKEELEAYAKIAETTVVKEGDDVITNMEIVPDTQEGDLIYTKEQCDKRYYTKEEVDALINKLRSELSK